MDTIFALATAQGKAGVAVVRVSGPAALDGVAALSGTLPAPRRATLRRIKDADGSEIDRALVLIFPAPHSFTGEDVAELHLHGSVAVVSAVLRRLSGLPGFRMAGAGEFTRRALDNNRLDLTEVEGLADLIEAETEAQRVQALRVLSGELGARAQDWRSRMIRAASLLEASIDFADEEVPEDVSEEVLDILSSLDTDLSRELDGIGSAERIRSGFTVAIVGPPNVGKSTLLNAIAGRDAAIVSEVAGTTRDVIEVRMDLGGLPVTLLDTAGLRETEDQVEAIGVDRARRRAAEADLRVFLTEDGVPAFAPRPDDLVVRAKADERNASDGLAVSGKTGLGLRALLERITETLANRAGNAGLATRERHRTALSTAQTHARVAAEQVALGQAHYDIAAEELRIAIRALELLIGLVDVEDLLDEIFSAFCVGK